MGVLSLLVAGLLYSTAAATDGIDPILNYCKLVEHQSTFKNGKIYVDGGNEVFVGANYGGTPAGVETWGQNLYLLQIDMTNSWDWKEGSPVTPISKAVNSQTGTFPPVVQRGGLFAGDPGDNKIWLYGGSTSYLNESFPIYVWPDSSHYNLWSFDTVLQSWDQYDYDKVCPEAPMKPNAGAYASASDQGLMFYLNGQIDAGTSSFTEDLGSDSYTISGLVVIDATTPVGQNFSTQDMYQRLPRTRATMVYVPTYGASGLQIVLGGTSQSMENNNDTATGDVHGLDTIEILNIASLYNGNADHAWYNQTATGEIPEPRMDFCAVYASAADNSSAQIFLYGGRNNTNFFDDVYTLSIPAFVWTRTWQSYSPRAFHKCELAAGTQMITIGGSNDTDFLRGCDWETAGLAVYDLTTLEWGSVYNATYAQYLVPQNVSDVIGGGPMGHATMLQPRGGFDSPGLATIFSQRRVQTNENGNGSANSPSNPTSWGSSGKMITWHIVLICLFCAGVLLSLPLAYFYFWYWKPKRSHPLHKKNLGMPPFRPGETDKRTSISSLIEGA